MNIDYHEEQQGPSRYIIGIDLGTTNSAVSFVDTQKANPKVADFPVLQLTGANQTERRDVLPSFHYESAEQEFPEGALEMPWEEQAGHFVGIFAREHGARTPGRLITSAKSWLSHAGVDREAPILPWHASSDVQRLSPVDVTARYLRHVLLAWNHAHPEYPLESQDVTITVPASFDEVARELTVAAAKCAGYGDITLLEEPQAAFYSWISTHPDDWAQKVTAGQTILVADVGGGTTDFTLIEVRQGEQGPQFHRIAVGDHLILGGDNLDLALAYHAERKTGKGKIAPDQFSALVRSCQHAKEVLLGDNPPEQLTVTALGRGTSLIGGALQIPITREEARSLLLDGFLPEVPVDSRPERRQSGFQEFGLPYAPDPGITRYLSQFLSTHFRGEPSGDRPSAVRPDVVLLNGGVLSSPSIRERFLSVLTSWFGADTGWKPDVLQNTRPELAVARGAAYFGLVRRGLGVRITAGLPRSYYIGVEAEWSEQAHALCIVPAGMQEGETVQLSERPLRLLIRKPVEFPLYSSSVRTIDEPGTVVEVEAGELSALPPMRTVLRSGKRTAAETVMVELHARLTPIGTMELWCSELEGNRSWQLHFDVRATPGAESPDTPPTPQGVNVEQETIESCREILARAFEPGHNHALNPASVVKQLEQVVEIKRDQWPPSLLRALWESLLEKKKARHIDAPHELQWLNLVGYCLRPGMGYPLDDWRVKETWKLWQQQIAHPRNEACRSEWWILWRRIAGGLNAGQQKALAQPLLSSARAYFEKPQKRTPGKKKAGFTGQKLGLHEAAEIWRLLGSCERLSIDMKTEIGETALAAAQTGHKLSDALVWAVGRIAARTPLYGPLNTMIPLDVTEQWLDRVLDFAAPSQPVFFALTQMSRKTDDRYRDISDSLRERVRSFLTTHSAPSHLIELIDTAGYLDDTEADQAFGEALPRGLRLV